ncbi:MAG: ATP-binding cassette domain-containing protein [Cyanobacteria bacterium J06627_32]
MLLRVECISKTVNRTRILDNVSFTLDAGESMLVKGESGCGKTTLLRCIASLEQIDTGQITLNGQIISHSNHDRARNTQTGIGMVFQQLFLWPHMTVLENVALPLRLQRRKGRKDRKIANENARHQLSKLGIEDKARDYPSQLSGGQKQRVALARALALSPQILLLDEITASLDPGTAHTVVEIIEDLIMSGTSVIWVTHSVLPSSIWSYVFSYNGSNWSKEIYTK